MTDPISVRSEWDRVIIVAGATDITLPYAAAFKISLNLKLAAKDAMRMVHEDINGVHAGVRDVFPVLNPTKRRTMDGKFDWSIKIKDNDERVYVFFGNVEIVLHWKKALDLSSELRAQAMVSKAWAGDGGRVMNVLGSLRDAEHAYRYGLM